VYARSTTIRAQTSNIDAGIAHIRDEVMPVLSDIDGFVGMSLLVDRESGRCIATSAWQSEEAMRASAAQVTSVRNRAAEIFGGGTEMSEWEIAVLHRARAAPEGACTRVTWTDLQGADPDRAIDTFKMSGLPRMVELTGFCSASLLVDRAGGLGCSAISYDSRAALDVSRDPGSAIRESVMAQAGIRMTEMAEFELAVAHLRVPEMV
jgi:heme-degrading monooxygenase HmoA